jgi:hypothetical protein
VIGQVCAHAGTVRHHRDVVLTQVVGRADARQHQQLGAAHRPGGQDDLDVGRGEHLGAALQVTHPDGAAALDLDRDGQGIGRDGQVRPPGGRMQVGVRRRPPPAAPLGHLVVTDAVLAGAVEVVIGGLAATARGGHEGPGQAGLKAQVLHAQRA